MRAYADADDQVGADVSPQTENQYDKGGNIRYTIDAIGNSIQFQYDANGNQTNLVDGAGNCTIFVYDGLNRKTSTIYPTVGSASATHEDAGYDLLGNRTQRTDCNGAITKYKYDDRSRLELVSYMNGSVTNRTRSYAYDAAGNLINVVESADANACVFIHV